MTATAVATGLLIAPFMHVHAAGLAEEHMSGEHAGALAFHIHVGEGATPYFGSLEATAQQLNWFVLKKADPPVLPAVVACFSRLQPPTLLVRSAVAGFDVAPADSPPLLGLAPRAPPA